MLVFVWGGCFFVFFDVSMHVCVLGFVWIMNSMLPSALSHAVCDTEA